MKKLLIFALALAAVFTFSQAFAVTFDPVCSGCGEKCDLGYIPCTADEYQGSTSTCPAFDYETRLNYCTVAGTNGLPATTPDCRVIFNICNCPDPEQNFQEDDTINIRLTLLVDGSEAQYSATWAQTTLENFGSYATLAAACIGTVQDKSFGTVYNLFDYLGVPRTPIAGPGVCHIPLANAATVMMSTTGYQITAADVAANLSHWWLNIPQFRIDPWVLHNGELISVLIELLSETSGGICGECDVICECEVPLAIVCCPTAGPSTDCIYYPYVLQQEEGWMSGIAVSNLGFVAGGSWTATFIFTDADGVVFTFSKTYTKGTVASNMDDLVAEAGWSPAAGAGWLKVTAVGATLSGYQYNMLVSGDVMFGAGVLSIPCSN